MKSFKRRASLIVSTLLTATALGVFFTNCSPASFESLDVSSLGNDPFMQYAWHLGNSGQKVFATQSALSGNDLNLQQTWASAIFGNGIKILVSDDGLEDTHEDLNSNFYYGNHSKNYRLSAPWVSNTAPPGDVEDNHGTAVAGLIAAAAFNGVGSRGVAPRAQVAVANFLGTGVQAGTAEFIDQATGNFDIFNMSWGTTQNAIGYPDADFESQLKYAVTNGRSGKGSLYIKAAGNDFFVYCRGSDTQVCIGSANFDPDNSNPYVLVTGALGSRGYAASYSSAGSNLWVSTFGGEYGDDSPAMVTTDRMGCSRGYSYSGATLLFDRGGEGNNGCNYSVSFNGTSSAAPVLSGAVALILEANPTLTWRDVKYILAKTAKKVHPTAMNIPHPRSVAGPSGMIWEPGWFTNAAGFHFHNWYGFGQVDVDAAVAMAKSYVSTLGSFTQTNWAHSQSGLNVDIPDFSATGGTATMSVSSTLKAEAVQLKLYVTHANLAQLGVELTSPSGTKSVLVNINNSLTNFPNYMGEVLLSNAFYGEPINGTWTLRVIDGTSGTTGKITGWSLNFSGSN